MKNDCLDAATAVLDEAGISYSVGMGGKHPRIDFEVNGRRLRMTVPGSTGDRRSHRNSAAEVRRMIRGAQNEADPDREGETMSEQLIAPVLPLLFEGFAIRTIEDDDCLWFVASDCAKPLGYRMASDATRILDEDEKGTRFVRTPGGPQDLSVISEPGLYKLIARSSRPEAKRFDRWVRHEVLPSLRKHGAYATDPAVMAVLKRLEGMTKMLSHKAAVSERALAAASREIADARAAADLAMEAAAKTEARLSQSEIAPTLNLAATVTSDDLIAMAGIKVGERVRGTSAMVTGRVLMFTAGHNCFKTPSHLNPSMPWRFPREKATEWLFGSSLGSEQIRAQVARQRSKRTQRSSQGHLRLIAPAQPSSGD